MQPTSTTPQVEPLPEGAYSFDVLTLFPPLFDGLRAESLIGKALQAGRLGLGLHDFRQWTTDRHHTVDDEPFGGGPGMVLKPGPVLACMRDVLAARPAGVRTVLLSPAGRLFDQERARQWAATPGLVLLCGRYEGFDARVEAHVDEVVSIGDYVLNGGEVAAMAIIEAVARLLPGVIGNVASLQEESHGAGLLEYPQFTRPREFEGAAVPDVLLSGNHAAIALWRYRQSLLRTHLRRPELMTHLQIAPKDRAWLLAELERTGASAAGGSGSGSNPAADAGSGSTHDAATDLSLPTQAAPPGGDAD